VASAATATPVFVPARPAVPALGFNPCQDDAGGLFGFRPSGPARKFCPSGQGVAPSQVSSVSGNPSGRPMTQATSISSAFTRRAIPNPRGPNPASVTGRLPTKPSMASVSSASVNIQPVDRSVILPRQFLAPRSRFDCSRPCRPRFSAQVLWSGRISVSTEKNIPKAYAVRCAL
jgi:hypothetical protein